MAYYSYFDFIFFVLALRKYYISSFAISVISLLEKKEELQKQYTFVFDIKDDED